MARTEILRRTISFQVRTALCCIVLLTVCRDAIATSVLLRSASKSAPELFPVQTYAGKSGVSITAIQPSSSVTVVLLMDTLTPAQLDNAKRELLALYTSMHGHPLRLALLRSSSLGVAGPFASRSRLKSALEEAAQAASDPAPVSLPAIIDALCAAAPQLGADCSHVLLFGELPSLDPLAIEYASALLLRAFGTQRIQLSWSAPSGGNDAWLPVLRSTGGGILRGPLTEFSISLDEAPRFSFQVDWIPVAPSAGFVVSHFVLADQQGQSLLEASDLAASASASLPSLESYSAMRMKT